MNQDKRTKTDRDFSINGAEGCRTVAESVRAACIETAVRAYEDAGTSGLCTEGAFECAIGAMKTLDLDKLLREIG